MTIERRVGGNNGSRDDVRRSRLTMGLEGSAPREPYCKDQSASVNESAISGPIFGPRGRPASPAPRSGFASFQRREVRRRSPGSGRAWGAAGPRARCALEGPARSAAVTRADPRWRHAGHRRGRARCGVAARNSGRVGGGRPRAGGCGTGRRAGLVGQGFGPSRIVTPGTGRPRRARFRTGPRRRVQDAGRRLRPRTQGARSLPTRLLVFLQQLRAFLGISLGKIGEIFIRDLTLAVLEPLVGVRVRLVVLAGQVRMRSQVIGHTDAGAVGLVSPRPAEPVEVLLELIRPKLP